MQKSRKPLIAIIGASVLGVGLAVGTSFAATAATSSSTTVSHSQSPEHGIPMPKKTSGPVSTRDVNDDHGTDAIDNDAKQNDADHNDLGEHPTPEPGDDNGHDAVDNDGGEHHPGPAGGHGDHQGNGGQDDGGHHDGGHHDANDGSVG
jgi:hypothetical protein